MNSLVTNLAQNENIPLVNFADSQRFATYELKFKGVARNPLLQPHNEASDPYFDNDNAV
jgi:hypothetical protein